MLLPGVERTTPSELFRVCRIHDGQCHLQGFIVRGVEAQMTHEPSCMLRHLPAWHAVAPATHWMNDPNGLWCDGDGLWHLWFQYRDDPPAYSRTHWGRLVSRDRLVWSYAGTDFAADADSDIYSGCVVEADGAVLRAYVTRHRHGRGSAAASPPSPSPVQQAIESWQRDRRHAAWRAAPPTTRVDPGLRDFRDPFVFRYGSSWRMLVAEPCPWDAAAGGPARSRLQVLRSVDGLHWEQAGAIGPWDPPRVMWEVPQLLPLSALQASASGAAPKEGELWVLLVSVLDRRAGTPGNDGTDIGCSVRWHLGTFDGARFDPVAGDASPPSRTAPTTLTSPVSPAAEADRCTLSGRLLDHGPDFYAACLQTPSLVMPTGPALMAWMSHWAYARRLPLPGFAGGPMTLPRQLAWVDNASGNGIRQQPLAALDHARCGAPLDTPMQALNNVPCTVARKLGSLDLEIRLQMAPGGQAWLRLAELGPPPPDGGNSKVPLALHIDALAHRITLHRAPFTNPESNPDPDPNRDPNPAPGFAGAWFADWTPDVSGEVAVRLLLDGCCAEIFIDSGAVVFSALVFLPAHAVCTLSAEAGTHVQLLAARAWLVAV